MHSWYTFDNESKITVVMVLEPSTSCREITPLSLSKSSGTMNDLFQINDVFIRNPFWEVVKSKLIQLPLPLLNN